MLGGQVNLSLHVRHVATHKERHWLAVFAKRRVGLTRPRNDPGMFPRQSLRGPYRPVFGLLLGWPIDWLEVAGLIAVESGDDDQLWGLLLRKNADLTCSMPFLGLLLGPAALPSVPPPAEPIAHRRSP